MLITPEYSPEKALELAFDQLAKAASDSHNPLRLFTFSTVDTDKNSPQNRIVVLRHLHEDHAFEFYTDYRSSKVKQLQINPAISALFWDPDHRVQVRISGHVEVHHQTELSKKRWKNIPDQAKKDYGTILSPGSPIINSDEKLAWDTETALQNFTVINCIPEKIEVLQIRRERHLSLLFTFNQKSQKWEGEWQVP